MMKKVKGKLPTKQNNRFKSAVESTPDVANGYRSGLSAMGPHTSKISVASTLLIEGSVDIDTCTTAKYPNSNRWDYVFAYDGRAYFVEVHSANTSEVRTVLNKLQWLKDWLNNNATEINKLKAKNPFYWIQSKGFAIPKTSPQYRAASNAGIKPVAKLNLE